jgi:hypothetical protein
MTPGFSLVFDRQRCSCVLPGQQLEPHSMKSPGTRIRQFARRELDLGSRTSTTPGISE